MNGRLIDNDGGKRVNEVNPLDRFVMCPFCGARKIVDSYDTEQISVSHCGESSCKEKAWDRYEEIIDYGEAE